MARNRMYALAVLVTVAAVAGPALAGTVQSHAAKHAGTTGGPRGPRGPRGAPGARGARGARGQRGLAGVAGPAGPAGAAGADGLNGSGGSGASPLLRTIVVSPSGTGAAANGALLAAAVAGIGGADAANPYLVSLEPGVYDLGSTPLRLPAHVDLQGSGQDVTTISGEGELTLSTAPGTEVRELTVSDADATGPAEAIDASGGLRDVTAAASGTSAATAVLADAPTMPIVDVTASATTSASSSFVQAIDAQGAVTIDGGSFTATEGAALGQAAALFAEGPAAVGDATLQASGGANPYPVDVVASSATVTVTGSTLIGGGGFFVSAGDTLGVGGSEVPAVAPSGAGTANCPDDWLPDFATAGTDCH
jgi:hypothetical protein